MTPDFTQCERCDIPRLASRGPCDCPKSRSPEHLVELVTTRDREVAVRFAAQSGPPCTAGLGHWTLANEECVAVVALLDSRRPRGED